MKYIYPNPCSLRRLLLLFTCMYFFFNPQAALAKGGISEAPQPAWVEEVKLSTPSTIRQEDVSDGYLFLLKDYQFHVENEQNYYHFIRKIYSTTGVQKGSQVEVWYDPSFQKVVFHQVKIIRGEEIIEKLDIKKFKLIGQEQGKDSYIYDESLSALLILEDVREGDLIEYAYSIVGRNPVFNGTFFSSLYLEGYDPMQRLFVKVIMPTERPLHIKTENIDIKPLISEQGTSTVYQWNLENLKGVQPDNDLPYWYNPYPMVYMGEFNSWKKVNDWALKLYITSSVPGKNLKEAIESIKKIHKKSEDRLEAALHVVQNEVRYTGLESGIGGYKPRDPSLVYEQKFGDCKDKALLLCYMLQEMGIEAWPALVNTTSRGEINKFLPSPFAFNHCVARVELSGKAYWYDPTIANQGGGFDTMYFPNYEAALVIKEDTKELTKIPPTENTKIKVVENIMINDIKGETELSITTEYFGYEADDQRYYFSNNNLKEVEKNYLNYASKYYSEIELLKPLIFSDNKTSNVFTTYESYKITNFFYVSDSTKPERVECLTYPQTLRDKLIVPRSPKRRMPLSVNYPENYEHTVNLILPEPWNIEDETTEITSAASKFKRSVSYKRGVVTIDYSYKTLKNHVTPGETASFIKKQNQILDYLGYGLTYDYSPDQQISQRRDTNWLLVLLTLLFAGASLFIVSKLYKYDPVPEGLYAKEKPIMIGGWLYLVALSVVLGPIADLSAIMKNDYFTLATWEYLTKASSEGYNPTLALMVVAELCFNVFSCVYSILLIVLFFKKRTSFPLLMSLNYGFTFFFIAVETYILYKMGNLDSNDIDTTTKQLVKLIISGAIWIPYLYLSERSKETFLKTWKVPEGIQEVYKLKV